MTVFEAKDLRDLATFKHQEGQLAILERQPLGGGDIQTRLVLVLALTRSPHL